MKLYDAAFAPSPRRVRFFLAEKGISVPTVTLDMARGEHQQPDFLAINALGELPVLELDDGTRLTESIAICRYLESLHPEPRLFGRDARETAEIEMWTLRLMFRMYVPTAQAFRNTHKYWADRIRQVPEYGLLAREAARHEFERLDERLGHSAYVAGDRYSFADIVAFTTLEFGKPSDIRIQPTQANLRRWYEEIAARPAAKA